MRVSFACACVCVLGRKPLSSTFYGAGPDGEEKRAVFLS